MISQKCSAIDLSMASHLLLGTSILLLFLALIFNYIFVPAFISPLSKIPNAHPTCAISSLWIRQQRRRGTETRSIFAAHQRLGPLIRLAPDEISVNSLDGLRIIYQGGFERHPWYQAFENFGEPNLISLMDRRSHSVQKRRISNVYSKSFLQNSIDLAALTRIVIRERFLPFVRSFAEGRMEVNVLELAQSVGMDMTSGYVFGSENGTNFLQDVTYRRRWLETYDVFKNQPPRDRVGGETERSCMEMCEKAEDLLVEAEEKKVPCEVGSTMPVVVAQLLQHPAMSYEKKDPASTSVKPPITKVASETLDHLIAGHESTGITLTYAMYELSLRPTLQALLRSELHTLSPSLIFRPLVASPQIPESPADLPHPSAIDSLPLLNAILHETLRLHPAVPAPQPRVTPHRPSEPVRIESHEIPGGVRISCNAYSLHRKLDVFPEPDTWMPERWLADDNDGSDDEKKGTSRRRKEMSRWFWVFGSGGRMCLGSHFAVQNIKLILASIYTNFETDIVDDTGIEQEDTYVAGPVGKRLVLRFKCVDR